MLLLLPDLHNANRNYCCSSLYCLFRHDKFRLTYKFKTFFQYFEISGLRNLKTIYIFHNYGIENGLIFKRLANFTQNTHLQITVGRCFHVKFTNMGARGGCTKMQDVRPCYLNTLSAGMLHTNGILTENIPLALLTHMCLS